MIWGGWTLTRIPDPEIAVDLFMLISGFLMLSNARRRESVEPMEHAYSWFIFYVRRFFRIAPVYYLALLIVCLVFGRFKQGYTNLQLANPAAWPPGGISDPNHYHITLANIVVHISFLFGFIPEYATSTGLPDWSLGLEMQFYLAFPALYCIVRRCGVLPVIIFGSMISYAITVPLIGVFPEPSFLPLKLPLFLVGMLIADVSAIGGYVKLAGAALLAVALCFAQVSNYGDQAALLVVACGVLFALSVPQLNHFALVRTAKSLLGGRLAHFMSEASYSVYLFHGFFIAMTGYVLFGPGGIELSGDDRTIVLLAAAIPGAYVTSAVVNRYVERPGIYFGAELIRRMTSVVSKTEQSTA